MTEPQALDELRHLLRLLSVSLPLTRDKKDPLLLRCLPPFSMLSESVTVLPTPDSSTCLANLIQEPGVASGQGHFPGPQMTAGLASHSFSLCPQRTSTASPCPAPLLIKLVLSEVCAVRC